MSVDRARLVVSVIKAVFSVFVDRGHVRGRTDHLIKAPHDNSKYTILQRS